MAGATGRAAKMAGMLALIMPVGAQAASFDVDHATALYLAMLSGPARARSDAYFDGGLWLNGVSTLVTVLACWLILRAGLLVRLRDAMRRQGWRPWVVMSSVAALFLLSLMVLQLPWSIYVDFLLPQKAIAQIKVGQPLKVKVDTFADKQFTARISSINSKVDPTTRNIQIRATVDNNDRKLLPGMFATVSIESGAPQKLVTVPQTAITYNPYGNLVYIVDNKGNGPDGKPQLVARQTFVTTGATRGDQVSVLKGIKEGDEVVIAGQMKLRNGIGVVVNNTVIPSNDVNPKPVDQ